uniref:Uncharacterized protein n=1 Tax=Hucho hucho TaxID=62062 RepID=A0A4W5NH34_9TELE
MVEGKPYRYGLIAAGMCVLLVGLFVMTQERPHIYATLCSLGITMVTLGTAWSLCQCYPKRIECSFLYHKPPPTVFYRIWQYIQPAVQPQTTCNHASPGPTHPASSPAGSSEEGEGVLRSISVFNKALLWGEKIILIGWAWIPSGLAYSHPWLHPCQSCEIHRLGPNSFISID